MENNSSPIDYSIIIPVYFNEGALLGTMRSITKDVIEKNKNRTCEIIFVDDGSGDGSISELLKLYQDNPSIVKIIKFTRNFGQPSALLAGFSYARGKCVIAISADGQDPVCLINDMLDAYFNEKYEIVACTRQGRDESWYRIFTSKFFYSLIKRLTFPNMPIGGFDFVLLGRSALNVFLSNQEAHPFFQGQILWTGFKIKFIPYHRMERKVGTSRWTFGKKITYLLDGVLSYSYFPIRIMSLLGMIAALMGFLYAGMIFLNRLFYDVPIKGWAPLMIVILVMGGMQMIMLGVIGEYLWRALAQVRNREAYVVEQIYDDVKISQ